MPEFEWSKLNHLQIGRYAEQYVSMEFTLHGLSVFTSEVDDRGIDCVVRKDCNTYYDVQVKSVRKLNYIFFQKDKFVLKNNLLAAIVLYKDAAPPGLYLIPSLDWLHPNELLKDKDYAGQKSKPEWGINLSTQTMPLLQKYAFDLVVGKL